jgi:hypothetical protein
VVQGCCHRMVTLINLTPFVWIRHTTRFPVMVVVGMVGMEYLRCHPISSPTCGA